MSEQFGKGKTPYQPGRVHEENCKSAKGNFVIKFLGVLRSSGPAMGQLWKGRAQNREALGAGFSSLLLSPLLPVSHAECCVQGKGAKQIWY